MNNEFIIPQNILDNSDIAGLMKKMARADWYYDYSEDPDIWHRGNQQILEIKNELKQLCALENGRATANKLWEAYVPEYSVSKPDFITLFFNDQNIFTMNEKNLEALKNNLKYLGFGEGLNEQLEKNIREQKPEFTLQHEVTYNNQKMLMDLSFKGGDQNDMYFFNKYSATLDDKQQSFYLDRGNGVTTKEAFNLLQGRAVNKDLVNKEGEKYNAWVQLNFSKKEESGNYKMDRYHENYNYNFVREVQNLVLKPMPQDQEKQLMLSLQKGNIQSATFLREGEEVKMFVEANPKGRTINIYDGKMNRLTNQHKQEFIELSSTTKQQKQKNEPGGKDDDDGPELKKKRSRKKGMSI
jgi:hypothetical protein